MDEDGHLLPAAKGTEAVKRACMDVLKNPLIIGIVLGLPFALFQWKIPVMVDSALSMVGGTASPVALLVVGASFSGGKALPRWKSAMVSSLVKLWLLPLIFLPMAAMMGFHGCEMIAILIMVGFVMAKNMHADTVLTSNAVRISTVFSSVSITFWLFALRSFGLI